MNVNTLKFRSLLIFLFFSCCFCFQMNAQCPTTFYPVCATNGTTYWNSCYAQQAGQTEFTVGLCSTDLNGCVDPFQINGTYVPTGAYNPVCGCNGITYPNAIAAEEAGVESTTDGACNGNVNYTYLATLNYYAIGGNGEVVLEVFCPANFDPVCGCGRTFPNACAAVLQGCTYYVSGECEDDCLDEIIIVTITNQTTTPYYVDCPSNYDPVCGCNNITYENDCYAFSAGITEWTSGACGGSSLCGDAIPIGCGEIIFDALTASDGNDFTDFTCPDGTFTMDGVDKVYVINKNQVGDLQIGLEILPSEPSADLDIYLLDGNCQPINCLDASTLPNGNQSSNNEGIVLEEAPIGTYYLVVDTQFPNVFSDYRLEIGCGYLSCDNAVDLSCGLTYSGSNEDGLDVVTSYFCPDLNTLNVDNNGNEIVHSFFLPTAAGVQDITVTLSNLDADLELFLLDACDRSRCIGFSENTGTQNETIEATLLPGLYYVVVDGYNGAISDYDLFVDLDTDCVVVFSVCDDLLVSINESNGICDEVGGVVNVAVSDGDPTYSISLFLLDDPNPGNVIEVNSATTFNNHLFSGLKTGNYRVDVTDIEFCAGEGFFSLNNSPGASGLNNSPVAGDATCGQANGSISIPTIGGVPPYTVSISGSNPLSNFDFTFNNLPATADNLPPNTYTIIIADANGCSDSDNATVGDSGTSPDFFTIPSDETCTGLDGTIDVVITQGSAPMDILIDGSLVFNNTFDDSNLITGLAAGTYQIEVIDSEGCSFLSTATVESNAVLTIMTETENATCGAANGTITVNSGGQGPFSVAIDGIQEGTNTNLPMTYSGYAPGNYNVIISDASGCSSDDIVTVNNTGTAVTIIFQTTDANCNANNGSATASASGGNNNFTYNWSNAQSGATINNLSSGTYSVTATDTNGCSAIDNVTVGNTGANIIVGLASTPISCDNDNGTITVSASGGNPPYSIFINGNLTNSNVTNFPQSISNLSTGFYTISVEDADGCSGSQTTNVNDIGNPQTITLESNPANCGGADGSISIETAGGTPPYIIVLNGTIVDANVQGNEFPYIIPNLAAGTYLVGISDTDGCSNEDDVTVGSTGANISVDLTSTPVSCDNDNGTITVSASGGNSPYSIFVNGNLSNANVTNFPQNISNLSTGFYTISVEDADGCSGSQTTTINDIGNPQTITLESNPANCGGADGSISIETAGGTPPYVIVLNGTIVDTNVQGNEFPYTIPSLAAGTYLAGISDTNGCSNEDNVTVASSNGNDIISAIDVTDATCGNPNGSIDLSLSGGSPPYTVYLDGALISTMVTAEITMGTLFAGTYIIEMFDINECSVIETVMVDDSGNLPSANFDENINNLTVSFINLSTDATSYAWDFGDGNTSTAANPIHSYGQSGTYQVCLIATNACGESPQFCLPTTVTIPANNVIVDLGDASGAQGDIVCVPVFIQNLDNVGSLEGDIIIQNPNIAQVVGIQDGVLTDVFLGPNNANFSFFISNGVDVTEDDVLFCIMVELLGNIDDMTLISFDDVTIGTVENNGTPVLVNNHIELDGNINIVGIGDLSGLISTVWNEGIGQVNVNAVSNSFDESITTGSDGLYLFSDIPLGVDYTITPEKNINPTNGIGSTFALLVMQQFILGFDPPQIEYPEQIIAADINCDDDANTFDLLVIQQMIVQNAIFFDNCPAWVFVDAAHVFPANFDTDNVFPYPDFVEVISLSNDLEIPFTGIKKGDILGDADPANLLGIDDRNDNELWLKIHEQEATEGEIIEIPVFAEDFQDFVSFQMGLNFDSEQLTFLDVLPNSSNTFAPLSGITIDEEEELRISWFSTTGNGISVDENTALFTIRFEAMENITKLSETISLVTIERFGPRAFNVSYTAFAIELDIIDHNLNNTVNNDFSGYFLHQNAPNPFSETTTIGFEIPNNQEVTLQIFNHLGRLVISKKENYQMGLNTIEMEKDQLGSGVFYYTLTAGDYTATKKMVIF